MSSPFQEFLDKISGKTTLQQQQVVNAPELVQQINTTNLTDLLQSVKGLFQVVKARHWVPRTFLVCDRTAMAAGTDGIVLSQFVVPSGKMFVLTNIDLMYTGTGSFRIKCQWGSMGRPVDFIEDTSTNLHWYGYMTMDPGSILTVTQGATTGGTGNIRGAFSGLVFDVS